MSDLALHKAMKGRQIQGLDGYEIWNLQDPPNAACSVTDVPQSYFQSLQLTEQLCWGPM